MMMQVPFEVGIMAHNEEANIGRLLQNLLDQAVGHQFNRTDFFHGAGIHGFQHLSGDLCLAVVMQPSIHTRH